MAHETKSSFINNNAVPTPTANGIKTPNSVIKKVAFFWFSMDIVSHMTVLFSYGVLIQNTSKDSDAVRVFALVNFVYSDNVLYGSATSMISVIGAGQTYALGGMLAFPSGAPVLRLEVVLQVGGREPHSLQLPELSNTRVMGSAYDPGWVGSVEGELANNVKGQVLQSTKLSTVILDAAGNVLGGGVGFAIAALPPGAREFYKITSGLPPIPLDKAASAVVSLEPRYRPVDPA